MRDAVLLAAGESTRMGELKALLPWVGDEPLIAYQVRQLLDAGVERTTVVVGHRAADVLARLPALPGTQVVHNPDHQSGKVSSIIAGAAACRSGAHVLVLSVDQPRPAALIQQVFEAHLEGPPEGAHRITIAAFQGRRGHPVVFSPGLQRALRAITEETEGLRAVLRVHATSVLLVETGDALALANLNTPAEYAAARRLAGLD